MQREKRTNLAGNLKLLCKNWFRKYTVMTLAFTLFLSIVLFLSPRRCFKYFKRRYSREQLEKLNAALRLRGKLNSVLFNVVFLRCCFSSGVAPKGIQARVRKAKVFHSLKIKKAFLKDELAKCEKLLKGFRRKFQGAYRQIQETISKTDFVRFSRCISECDEQQRGHLKERKARNLRLLCKKRYGLCLFLMILSLTLLE